MAKYNLADCVQQDLARERLEHLIEKGSESVEIIERRKLTSYPQKQYLHLIRSWFGLETGYNTEEVEAIYKIKVNSDIYVRESNPDGKLAKSFKYIRNTADLTTEESSICIERFRNWSQQTCNIYLPSKSEENMLLSINRAMEEYRNKIFMKGING